MKKVIREIFLYEAIFVSKDFNLDEPEETGKTYVDNARIKAEYTSNQTGLACLSDDSGIEVNGLNGAPGVYTANWAEGWK